MNNFRVRRAAGSVMRTAFVARDASPPALAGKLSPRRTRSSRYGAHGTRTRPDFHSTGSRRDAEEPGGSLEGDPWIVRSCQAITPEGHELSQKPEGAASA